MKIFYLHFNEAELKERVRVIANKDYQVLSHCGSFETSRLRENLPDVMIVSLDRLPSHGRQYVQWLWEAKKRQHIRVIFVDGLAAKVDETKLRFQGALYCRSQDLPGLLSELQLAM